MKNEFPDEAIEVDPVVAEMLLQRVYSERASHYRKLRKISRQIVLTSHENPNLQERALNILLHIPQ